MTQPLETLTQWVTDLASPDEHVRDETALSGLIDAVLGDDPVADDTARAIYDHALRDQGPLSGVGAPEGEDGVFGRSFTLELLAVLHHRENASPFLGRDRGERGRLAWQAVVEHENDFRSRVEGAGWAHVVAHAADLADELLVDPGSDDAAQRIIVAGVATLVSRSPRVYDGEEEDRLAQALCSAVGRRAAALDEIVAFAGRCAEKGADDVPRQNWKAVVRGLFFRVGDERDDATRVLRDLEQQLVRI